MNFDHWFKQNWNTVVEDLTRLIAFESISTLSAKKPALQQCAGFLINYLKNMGFKTHLIGPSTPSTSLRINALRVNHPAVWAARIENDKLPTVLIYGHYDVQPIEPVDEWQTPPFKLTLKNKRFYGRGTADNKGQLLASLWGVKALLADKKSLGVNLCFLIEGEEEIGSCNFEAVVKQIKTKPDLCLIIDMGMPGPDQPVIFYGLRGIAAFELIIKSLKQDLHSGSFGGAVNNPVLIAAELLTKFKNSRNQITLPGFYDSVKPVSRQEKQLLLKASSQEKQKAKTAGTVLVSESGFTPTETTKIRPSFDVNGISAGWTGEGIKTVIPAEVKLKLSFRLVPKQTSQQVEKSLRQFLKTELPASIKWQLTALAAGQPFYTSPDNPWLKKIAASLQKVYAKPPLYSRSGGSIEAAEIIQRLWKTPVVLTGWAQPDSAIHAPNENLPVTAFKKGAQSVYTILKDIDGNL